jgi:hypothetical protein
LRGFFSASSKNVWCNKRRRGLRNTAYRLAVPPGMVQVNATVPETVLPAAGLVMVTSPGVGVEVGAGGGGFGGALVA